MLLTKKSELESRITNPGNDIKSDIINLKKEIESIAYLLPKYQQLSYSEQIKSLLDRANELSKPKRRFKLNRDKIIPKAEVIRTEPEMKPTDIKPEITRTNEVIVDEIISLSNVSNSIIILKSNSISIKCISNSVLILNSIESIFLYDVKDCLIYANSNQLRIHNSNNLKILNEIENNFGIIENSTNLKFNNNIKITDFNNPIGKSPNFSNFTNDQGLISLKSEILSNPNLNYLKDLESYLQN